LFNELSARLARPFRWMMVAAIAYTLAQSLTYLMAGPQPAPDGAAPAAERSTRTVRREVDVETILARNLFGVAGARPAAAQSAAPAAVATQLPLELRGVFVAEGDGESAAIIAQRGRPGQLYSVGQNVAGSATLESVHSDHVVLRRAGVAETLHFPRPGQGQALAPQMPASEPEMPFDEPMEDPGQLEPYEATEDVPMDDDMPPADDGAVSAEDALTSYRERLQSDPAGALQSLGMQPVSTGAAAGYRIDDLARVPYLGQTGLQPGDVILSVNGRPVGDLNSDRLEIDNVLAQGSARIEVQRGSRRFFVTASLPR
jgi:general secretion pathway protein C